MSAQYRYGRTKRFSGSGPSNPQVPVTSFDIYQTADGYVAVANATRRQILHLLGESERELPELVERTGKAKPTLSSVHMRDLVEKRLVRADAHPSDSRRKVYRLIAQKIGSSEVPVANLRDAVKEYVTSSPLAARYPLAMFVDALSAAPARADPQTMHAQARRLGALAAKSLQAHDASSFVMAAVGLLEREGIAKALRIDLEAKALDLAFGTALPGDAEPQRLAHIVGGLVEGMGRGRGWVEGPIQVSVDGSDRRCHLTWS